MSVWVVIAAYNEERMIAATLAGLSAYAGSIIVVDDGSSDATFDRSRAAGAIVLRHVVNLGQGAALQTGIEYALMRGASHICTFDADGQHKPEAVETLLSALSETGADIALGSRFLEPTLEIPTSRRYLLYAARSFTRAQTGLKLTDVHNGLRMFTREAAEKLRLTQPRMAHASEYLSLIARHKLKFVEVPTQIAYTTYSRAKGQTIMSSVRILFDLAYSAWTR